MCRECCFVQTAEAGRNAHMRSRNMQEVRCTFHQMSALKQKKPKHAGSALLYSNGRGGQEQVHGMPKQAGIVL